MLKSVILSLFIVAAIPVQGVHRIRQLNPEACPGCDTVFLTSDACIAANPDKPPTPPFNIPIDGCVCKAEISAAFSKCLSCQVSLPDPSSSIAELQQTSDQFVAACTAAGFTIPAVVVQKSSDAVPSLGGFNLGGENATDAQSIQSGNAAPTSTPTSTPIPTHSSTVPTGSGSPTPSSGAVRSQIPTVLLAVALWFGLGA